MIEEQLSAEISGPLKQQSIPMVFVPSTKLDTVILGYGDDLGFPLKIAKDNYIIEIPDTDPSFIRLKNDDGSDIQQIQCDLNTKLSDLMSQCQNIVNNNANSQDLDVNQSVDNIENQYNDTTANSAQYNDNFANNNNIENNNENYVNNNINQYDQQLFTSNNTDNNYINDQNNYIDNDQSNPNFFNETQNIDYADPTVTANAVDNHLNSLMQNFRDCVDLAGGSQEFTIHDATHGHGGLHYVIELKRNDVGDVDGVWVHCYTSDNGVPINVSYANTIGRILGLQIKTYLNNNGWKVGPIYAIDNQFFNYNAISNDHEFQMLESKVKALIESGQIELIEGKWRGDAQTLINNLDDGELKPLLIKALENGFTEFWLHRDTPKSMWRFDLHNPNELLELDVYDVSGYPIDKILPQQPVVPALETVEVHPQTITTDLSNTPPPPQDQFDHTDTSYNYMVPKHVNQLDYKTKQKILNAPQTTTTYTPHFMNVETPPPVPVNVVMPVIASNNKRYDKRRKAAIIVNKATIPVQLLQKHYVNKVYDQRHGTAPTQINLHGPKSVTPMKDKLAPIDISVGGPKKVKTVKRVKRIKPKKTVVAPAPKGREQNIFNIRTDTLGQTSPASGTTPTKSAPPVEAPQPVGNANGKPIIIMSGGQPQPPVHLVGDDVKMRIDHEDIVGKIQEVLKQQGQVQAGQAKEIVDNIKLIIENKESLPKEEVKMFDQILIKLDEAVKREPESIKIDVPTEKIEEEINKLREAINNIHDDVSLTVNNDEVLAKIGALSEKIDGLKKLGSDEHEDVKIEIPHLEAFSDMLKSIEAEVKKPKSNGEGDRVEVKVDLNEVMGRLDSIDKALAAIHVPEGSEAINLELNHLEDVDKKLQIIDEKLAQLGNSNNNTKLLDELKIELNDLRNDKTNIVLDTPDTKEIVDKLSIMIDQKLQEAKEDKTSIVIDSPSTKEIVDQVSEVIDEKLKGLKFNDQITVQQPEITVEPTDMSGVLDEMRKMISQVEENIKIQIDQKLQEQLEPINIEVPSQSISTNDNVKIEGSQPINDMSAEKDEDLVIEIPPEKLLVVNEYEQVEEKKNVSDNAVVEEKDEDLVIEIPPEKKNVSDNVVEEKDEDLVIEIPPEKLLVVNEYEQVEEKEEKPEVVNTITDINVSDDDIRLVENGKDMSKKEVDWRREPTIQGPMPMPVPGFMGAPLMPMMMPMPAPQPQQPIVITQSQSDEEEGRSSWSTFLKVLLILLLLASLIGLGFLLWKSLDKSNEQQNESEKNNDSDKNNTPNNTDKDPPKADTVEVKSTPTPSGQLKTTEGETAAPLCEDGKGLQLNVKADSVKMDSNLGNLTNDAKSAINLENAGTHNKLIASDGTTIDTRRIEINGNKINARDWNGSLTDAKTYTGTIENGKAVINGKTYTIANESGKAYSSGSIDLANQTSYTRNSDGTLSTNFGDLQSDMQINKNNTFTLNTTTENGTVVATNTVDDISNNATMQNILKNKLNDSSLTKGEYNRIMDALDDGKLNDSYFKTIENSGTSLSLNNSTNVENGASV